jgi:hypothetical protein
MLVVFGLIDRELRILLVFDVKRKTASVVAILEHQEYVRLPLAVQFWKSTPPMSPPVFRLDFRSGRDLLIGKQS